jgi:hypothetical protein
MFTPSSAEPDKARMMFSVLLSAHGLVSRDTLKITVRLVSRGGLFACATADGFVFFVCIAGTPFMENQ